jgi:carboxypeptidase family protein
MRRSGGWLLGAFLVITAAAPAIAQQGTAEIGGRVADEQGGLLPGTAIVITNEETGTVREVTSGADGSFFAPQLVPGRYKIAASLAGFQSFERGGLILQVGKTLTVNVTLAVGRIEETVRVTAESPLVDTTSAKVGGNIGTDELGELPAMNRNYFSTVALLPGIQFAPSNQMGNDTIVASGQTTQNNNVSVDGGYNGDDALGTSSGAQVRVPLESIQEFQVVVSMYDAEFGRASGAIVNAVTKVGTNQFKGVVFGYSANNKLTAMDYFVKQSQSGSAPLVKPTTTKREWGGVIGGPIVKNKAHFFFSLERQVDNPNRTRVYGPPGTFAGSRNFSLAEDRTDWNTLIRFDHQINANHTWAVRWLREWAPQWYTIGNKVTKESYQDETDLDQTAVGTLTSVLSNSRVNTVRVARTWEHWWHGNACFRAQGTKGGQEGFVFGEETSGNQALCPPQLNYPAFLAGASTESQGPWDSNYQIEDDYSWFLPGKKGDHDMKFGFRYNYTELRRASQINMNGTFTFGKDAAFNPADPSTYPERFSIRTGQFKEFINNHTFEMYAQDKWHVRPNTTLSLGVRYDLELIPIDETGNPLFKDPTSYPVDKNNISPRLGFTHMLDDLGRNVIRGGYGLFYNRTILGAVDDALEFGKLTNSVVVTYPTSAADPGPGRGQMPTDPFLVNGPVVNRALLNQLYPPNAMVKNDGTVIFDTPNRQQPYAHQFTIGYVRELAPQLALHVDYVKMKNKDMFLARNLNPGLRVDTSRTGAVNRLDAFGVLGEAYKTDVWVMENNGDSDYDGLNLSLEKRYSHNWSGRVSYSLSKSRGTGENQADRDTFQTLTDLNLDLYRGPSSVDRTHVLSIAARADIPKTHGANVSTTIRYMSGAPFTIYNSNVDVNRNGSLDDPVPAGTYSGPTNNNGMQNVEFDGKRNGARGPDYFQTDVRAGYRVPMRRGQAVELFLDIFNITNRANFDNPIAANRDLRFATTTFLTLTNLYGGGGFPRQAYFGVRYVF